MTDRNYPHADDGEIRIFPLRLAEVDPVLKFYESNLGTWKQFITFWDWRQNGNPCQREPKAVVARNAGEIVGCMSLNPVLIITGKRGLVASWQQDSLVLGSMRGKGLGKRLIHEANQACDLALAKGTSRSMYALRKAVGFHDVPNSNYLVRIEEPRPLKEKARKGVAEQVIALWSHLIHRPPIRSDIEVKRIDVFDSSFDKLATLLAEEDILRIFKDRKYLDWRYFQCPERNYIIFRAGGEKARGAIVINMTGDREGWIIDLISLSSDKQCIDALIAKAVDHFKTNHIARIWVFATLPSIRRRLYRFGFLPTPKTPRFTYSWNKAVPRVLNDISWDFWHGDGDMELYM